jgi:hypothetical protein
MITGGFFTMAVVGACNGTHEMQWIATLFGSWLAALVE